MKFDEYQKKAFTFARYDQKDYPYYALVEEVGELMGKLAKYKRGDQPNLDEGAIHKELGDILWQLSAICSDRGVALSYIANLNIQKLEDRAARNKIKGTGDDR